MFVFIAVKQQIKKQDADRMGRHLLGSVTLEMYEHLHDGYKI